MELKKRRKGLGAVPVEGWPLDEVLVGVGTLRTMRRLLRDPWLEGEDVRAWDVSLWSGVTAQGSSHCMARLERAGLVREVCAPRRRHAAVYRVVRSHALIDPMLRLFLAERGIAGDMLKMGQAQPPAPKIRPIGRARL